VTSCLFCHYQIPLLDAPIGQPGDPVGLCRTCSCMSCGWHGARTPSPAFICIVCDVDSLLSSAGWGEFVRIDGLDRLLPRERGAGAAEAPDLDAAADIARTLAALFSTTDGYPGLLVVTTLNQWFDERPNYAEFKRALDYGAAWAVQLINRFFRNQAGRGNGQKIDGHYDGRTVQTLWSRLGDDGKMLLAAAVLLIVTLDLPLHMLPPPVVDVARSLSALLRDFPDRISDLRRQITAKR
jgi:hypothetical protein